MYCSVHTFAQQCTTMQYVCFFICAHKIYCIKLGEVKLSVYSYIEIHNFT